MFSKLSKLDWYWHRLCAMGPGEILLRFQKKAYQRSDAKFTNNFNLPLEPNVAWRKTCGESSA